ncbi:methylmalonic aciduria and homocystinuria type D homolog, mitochondrial-like [Rhodnius prolixus]|uniref:Putative methylmalonic aciduria and cystinuria type d n=1 Tax=Rhodnius prolixus TaxID=13249 RepID=R4FJM5_RHOPR
MLFSKIFKLNGRNRWIEVSQKLLYSRKSSSNYKGSYKVVNKATNAVEDDTSDQLNAHSNWELLTPQGFRFYLPGAIGPAWHDEISASFMPSTLSEFDETELECNIQECPVLLRQGINELFSGTPPISTNLTVVTISQKKRKKNSEQDIERLTKQFMCAAQDICNKLKTAGYWADFINPFSGVPFNTPHFNSNLYKTDMRFRCLGFNIKIQGNCKVISDHVSNKFIGSLYTTAPPNTSLLQNILREHE